MHALDARAHFDGFALTDMAEGDRLVLKRSADAVRFVHPPGYRYFATLREKLRWSEVAREAPRHRLAMLRALDVRDFVIVERLDLELGAGFTRAHRRDRRRQVDPGRCDRAAGRRPRRRAAGARRRRARRAVRGIRVRRETAFAAWLEERGPRRRPGAADPAPHHRPRRALALLHQRPRRDARAAARAGEQLVDIHGQHEHQSLLRPAAQRALLDAHAGAEALARETARRLPRLEAARRRWRDEAREELRAARGRARRARGQSARSCKKLEPREGEWQRGVAPSTRGCSTARACSAARSPRSRRWPRPKAPACRSSPRWRAA